MKPVLAVFAKTPHPGKVKTRLAPEMSLAESAELYRCMLLDTISRIGSLSVDTAIFYEGDEEYFRQLDPSLQLIRQHPAGLGERLDAAFAALSALGYRERVVIGSDAPDLPLDFIEEAFRLLAGGRDAVFGPAEDGGYYLVGLSGETSCLFRDIPWSGPQVLSVSLERANEAGFSTALIHSWYDVDSYQDLLRPGLYEVRNAAPLTRKFLLDRGFAVPATAEAFPGR